MRGIKASTTNGQCEVERDSENGQAAVINRHF